MEKVVTRSNAIFRSSKIKAEESVGLRDTDGDHWISSARAVSVEQKPALNELM